jgi:hypothetical protein
MANAETSGIVEIGQWTIVPGGFEVLVEPLKTPNRVTY